MLVASERVADSSDKTLNISSIEDDLLVKIPEVLKDPEILINEQTIDINNGNSDETIEQKEQEHENLAEIHSSFEEVIPSNNGDNLESNEAATYIVPPEPLSDVSTG
ncbi:hypothetical protein C0J52_14660 [Blattella germanica]|nr:hypothetical protein C0J52_14660 [Blattella germanica]